MATATESTLQAKTISASLTVNDLQQSIKFFEGLGFAVEDRWEEQGKLLGVMLRAGDASIGLSQDDWKKGRDRQKGVGMRLFIGTKQDIDQIASRARSPSRAASRLRLARRCPNSRPRRPRCCRRPSPAATVSAV
jgi:catechol 2,3-dioxygenase-like lactoylglutathione lyase family enzyme